MRRRQRPVIKQDRLFVGNIWQDHDAFQAAIAGQQESTSCARIEMCRLDNNREQEDLNATDHSIWQAGSGQTVRIGPRFKAQTSLQPRQNVGRNVGSESQCTGKELQINIL